jgi:hypothetical protein
LTKKALIIFIILLILSMQPLAAVAQSDYEFYFFGVNLETYSNGNWLMIATGAATSLLAHELGHALYLESQGKNWNFAYSTSGLAVQTNDYLTDEQYRNFGRAGFALQAGIGALLTSFESTRRHDFTKGWVSMNAAQFYTYDHRSNDLGDDFALIEKGNGDVRFYEGSLAFISRYNLLKLEGPGYGFYNLADIEGTGHGFYNLADIEGPGSGERSGQAVGD